MMRKQIDVVGAVMLRKGSILCAQRGPLGALAGLWEFPGGKIEHGESPRAALEREIGEELECVIAVGDELTTTTHAYEFGDVTLTTFWCVILSGTPKLTEHSSVRWLPPGDLGALNWAPADIPAVQLIVEFGTPPELGAE
jgi:8-oxo-dGTP diphosphatase